MKVTIKATADQLRAATDAIKRVGEVADKITASTSTSTSTTSADVRKARASLRMWSAASFASLLDRIFGR